MMVPEPRAMAAYRAVAAMLAVAVALNLWLSNGLWLAYTVTGCIAFTVFLVLVHVRGWDVDPRAVWWGGSAAALHYVGGSLSGLHQIGGPNGLYFAFPWWDNVVHFLASAALAVFAYEVLKPVPARRLRALLAVCVASTLGVVVELYEFAGFLWFGTVDQGFYTNTVLDLYYNLLGAGAGALIVLRGRGARDTAPAARPAD